MDISKVGEGLKNHVFTPAARGAIQALLEQFTPTDTKPASRTLPIFALIGVGVVIGAGAALMLSPVTGKEVRAKVMALVSKLSSSKGKGKNASGKHEGKTESAKHEGDEPGNENGKPDGAMGANNLNRKTRGPITSSTP